MRKIYLFAALTAGLILTSCSSDDLTVKEEPQVQTEPGALSFDVYTQKATTRAGWTGSVTTSDLKNVDAPSYSDPAKLGNNGFGVFGFYTDNNEYEQRSVPNFMYNQQVRWNGTSAFIYEPVVYWPNEYGSNATSDDQDKLSFFAYAPYVKVVPNSGKIDGAAENKALEQWGITGMTKNTAQGDPVLKYIGSFDNKKSVDLCWGVADNGDGAVWNITQTGNPQTAILNGMPWIDLERPAGVDQKVRFTFKHATAQMRISIDADIDVDGRGHGKDVTKKTRIWVREVKFKGFTMKGSLNLNNDDASTPKWLDYNGQNELVAEDVVIYDGRKDGKEGVAGAVATNEKSLGLNPALVQDGAYAKGSGSDIYDSSNDIVVYGVDANGNQKLSGEWERPGVTSTAVNLFKFNNDDNKSQKTAMAAASEFFHVIPVNDNFEVEIVYDVETVDQNLAQNLSDGATKGSTIENRILKTITFGDAANNKLLSGHSYTLALHLGMNSVKFDAAVTPWIDEAAQEVDLPLNTPQFAVGNPATVTLPYYGPYTFAITGLDGGESVTTDPDDFSTVPMVTSATTNNANTSGVAIQTLETVPNPNTIDRSTTITWTGNQSGKGVEMTFTQKAHPLFLAIRQFKNDGSKGVITLVRRDNAEQAIDGAPTHWGAKDGWFTGTNKKLTVWRNGTKLKDSDVSFADVNSGAYNYTNNIEIADKLQPGDVIKVELTTGDAPTETVTATVAGIAYPSPTITCIYSPNHKYNVAPTYFGSVEPTYTFTTGSQFEIDENGVLTTKEKMASTEITAMLSGTAAPLALSTTAKFNLVITEQGSVIDYKGETIATPFAKNPLNSGSTPIDIIDLSGKKAKGATYPDDEAGNLTFTLLEVKRADDVDFTSRFKINGNKLQRTFDDTKNITSGNYVVKLKVEGEAVTDKFTKPADGEAYIHFSVE